MKHLKLFFLGTLSIAFVACDDAGDELTSCNGSLSLDIANVDDAVQDRPIGAIFVEADGGSPPYEFSLDGTEFVRSTVFRDLPGGTYNVTVQDANGCVENESVVVPEQLIVSYRLDVEPIIQANCNIALCHCNGNSLCFEEYSEVVRNQVEIGERTAQRAMPPDYSGKRLTDEEIELIGNWIYQGTANN